MFTYQLLEYSREMLSVLEDFEANNPSLFEFCPTIFDEEEPFIHADLIRSFANKLSLREFFVNFNELNNLIKTLSDRYSVTDIMVKDFKLNINQFEDSYQNFVKGIEGNSRIIFAMACFYTSFESVKSHFKSNIEMLTPPNYDNDIFYKNKSMLEIQMLDVEYSAEEFVEHLKSINTIYRQLALAMYPNQAIDELKVIKIESGSLFVCVLAEAMISSVFQLILTKSIEFAFDKFKRGKKKTAKDLRQEIRDDATLSSELRELGFDTSEGDENIEQAFFLATSGTLEMALSASKFKVNGKDLSIGETFSQRYMLEAKTLYIANKTNDAQEGEGENFKA